MDSKPFWLMRALQWRLWPRRLQPWGPVPPVAAVLMGIVLAATWAQHWPGGAPRAAAPETKGGLYVVTVSQPITGATTAYLKSALDRAQADQAEALIVEMDTPGGLLDATREIVQLELSAPLPLVVYIAPPGARAASAGTMITMAAHVAVMAPGTHIGAAHPVTIFGGSDDKVMGEKIVNDTVAFVESIAQLRGRNAAWAISSVRESKSITATKAVELKVVDFIAEDLPDLIKQLDGRVVRLSKEKTVTLHTTGRALVNQDMSVSQNFMGLVSNPNLVYLLMLIGMVGLYIELSHPGLIFPGVLGGICLLIALMALQTLPIRYGALGLMLLGAALLIAEAFVTSFGILGISGLASLAIGSLFLLDQAQTDLALNPVLVGTTVLVLGALSLVVGRLLVKSLRAPARSWLANLVGHQGEVREAIAPDRPGRVLLHGELWRARAATPLAPGTAVRVKAQQGLIVDVAPLEPGAAQESKPG